MVWGRCLMAVLSQLLADSPHEGEDYILPPIAPIGPRV